MPDDLVALAKEGDVRALARVITHVEDGDEAGHRYLTQLFPDSGRAHVIGLTGAPGSGKSTLSDRFITLLRSADERVAVVAVDPSSPFSGGAILGDRIRMQDHASDPGVYIRSLASRGHLGGLSAATPKIVAVLDGIGYPYVIVETVGVGQAEVEVVQSADTTVVVVNPGWGDSIQVSKAGLLEIADVFIVNKADRPGLSETVADLRHMLHLGEERPWTPPIVSTTANSGDGIEEAWQAIADHAAYARSSGVLERHRAAGLEGDLRRALAAEMQKRAERAASAESMAELKADVLARRIDPWSAAKQVADAATSIG